jgi:hypothetical protein
MDECAPIDVLDRGTARASPKPNKLLRSRTRLSSNLCDTLVGMLVSRYSPPPPDSCEWNDGPMPVFKSQLTS